MSTTIPTAQPNFASLLTTDETRRTAVLSTRLLDFSIEDFDLTQAGCDPVSIHKLCVKRDKLQNRFLADRTIPQASLRSNRQTRQGRPAIRNSPNSTGKRM